MQEVASGVNQLLGALGAGPNLAMEHQDPDGRAGTSQARPQVLDLLSDVQRGVIEIQQQANGQDALNHSLHVLIQNLGAEVERLAHERQSLSKFPSLGLIVSLLSLKPDYSFGRHDGYAAPSTPRT